MTKHQFDLRDLGCELGNVSRVSLSAAIIVCLGFGLSGNAHSQQVPASAVGGGNNTLDTIEVVGSRPIVDLQTIVVFGMRPPIERSTLGRAREFTSREPDPQPEYYDQMQPGNVSVADDTGSCANMIGNPVNYSTGNKIETEVDFVSGTGEMPLYLSRRYSPRGSSVPGIFGSGWSSNLDDRSLDPSFNLVTLFLHRPGGVVKTFYGYTGTIFYDNTESNASAHSAERIEKHPDGTFTYHRSDFGTEYYSVDGKLIEDRNPQGVKWTFTYSGEKLQRVTHSSGRYIQINWTGNWASSVVDPAGNVYTYGRQWIYPTVSEFQLMTLPGSPATVVTYHYASLGPLSSRHMVGKSFNGQRYSYFDYASTAGQVHTLATATYHAGNVNRFSFAYTLDIDGWITKTVTTNPLGQQVEHNFQNGKEVSTSVQQTAHCSGGASQTTYDWHGAAETSTDFNSNVTKYSYSDFGQLLEKTEAFGTPLARTTQNIWNGMSSQLLQSKVVGLAKVDYVYGPKHRIASVSTTNLSAYGVANQVRTTTYAYTEHANGLVASLVIDGPLAGTGDAMTYTYSTHGELLTEQNSLGHAVTYSNHNGLGQTGRVVGINGDVVDYTYDARGRVTKVRRIVASTNADTDYAYEASGLLASRTDPDGITTTYTYDAARRLTSEKRNAAGVLASGANFEEIRYAYDAASNVTAVSIYAGSTLKSISYVDYDEQGKVRARRGNNNQNFRYTYDANGNLKTITDSANKVTTQTYDALDRLISSLDPMGGVTRFEYDIGDRTKKVTDPRGLSTAYIYDGLGQLWAQHSPDTGASTFVYDAAGQLAGMTRNDGSWLTYAYDSLGRLYWSGTSTEARWFSYDWCNAGKSRLCGVSTADTQQQLTSTIYGYTPEGRINVKRDIASPGGVHDWTGFAYDNSGRLAGISYPSGVVVGYGYSGGKLTLMNAATATGVSHNVVSGIRYQPYGPAVSWTYGNGLTRNMHYDQNANAGDLRLTGLTTMDGGATLQSLLMGYDANNQITGITNYVDQGISQSYSYDALSRLTGMASPAANELIQYDATGNRTMHNWLAPIANEVDPASNRVVRDYASWGDGIVYAHDGRGNRASQSWNGSTTNYSYDAYNRLKSVSRTASTTYHNNSYTMMTYPAGITTYTTNALDQRVAKSNATTSARYVYSGQNTLLAENNNGQWASHLWLGGQPVGLIRGDAMYWTHTDHLNRPELVTNTIRQVVWRAKNFHSERGVILDSIGGYNLGLPGQYFDAETGLWYNGFRYYDSRLGRYTQSDPIGLAGGTNTYAYVGGNPVNAIDPTGLLDVNAIRFLGGEHRGQVRFTVTFYGSIAGFLRDSKSILMSALPASAKQLDRALTYIQGDPAGVSSIPWMMFKRDICDKNDGKAKEVYEKMFGAWSPTATISADQLFNFIGAVNALDPNLRYDAGLMITDATNGLPFE
jgi:RHS repeat-associated protein